MFDHASLDEKDAPRELPQNLVRALTLPVVNDFMSADHTLELLRDLHDVAAQIVELELEKPCREPVPESRLDIRGQIDQCHRKSDLLIRRIDRAYYEGKINEKGRVYTQTPGELCHRLMELTEILDHEIPVQNDTSVSQDQRELLLNRVAHLHNLRNHLQQCLFELLQDLRDGNAILPPHPEWRRYENPYVNPVTRKEVSIDFYSFAQKAHPLNKEVNHILGIACNGHGASLSYLSRDGTIRSSVFDRWAGTKYTLLMSQSEVDEILGCRAPISKELYDLMVYSYGTFPTYRVFEEVFPEWLDWFLAGLRVKAEDIDLLISSESNFVTSTFHLGTRLNQWVPRAQIVTDVEHHAVHQRQAFWQSGFEEAAVLTLDTCGENLARLSNYKLCGTITRMDRSGACDVLREFIFPHASSGLIYSIVNHHIGFTQGQEGKTMGLAPYGKPDLYRELVKHLCLYPDGSFDFLSYKELETTLKNYEYERPRTKGAEITQKHCDIAFAGQALIEDIVVNAFKAALRLTGEKNLVYAGGLGLNSVANEIANRAARPHRLYIPPNPSDTGQALGCALYAAYELAGWTPQNVEISEYLGPQYEPDEILQATQASSHHKVQRERAEHAIARCIANGHIVARFAGSAEFGPRALGNRSILADPRRKDMKDYLNHRVKHREGYRPFAPSVLLEQVSKWFDLDSRSPYMLRVVDVPPAVRDHIPAVVHVDGSARVQTVDQQENPDYWNLINTFYELTDVPLVLNTSFNVGGKPIVETPKDAVACFESTDIDVLLLEDWILSKRPLDEFETVSR